MAQSSTFIRSQFGVESVAGTAVPANKRFTSTDLTVKPERATEVKRTQGDAFDKSSILTKDESTVDFEGPLSYDEAGFVFASAYGAPATTEVETDKTWSHTWTPPVAAAPSDRRHFTIQHGAGTTVNQVSGCAVSSFEYSASRGGGEGKVDFKGSLVGGKVVETTFTASPVKTAGNRVSPLGVTVRLDDAWADVSTAAVTSAVTSVAFKADGLASNYSLANGTTNTAGTVVGETSAEFTLLLADGAEASALITNLKADCNQTHYIHIGFAGPNCVGGAEDFEFAHKAAIRVTDVSEIKGLDDNIIGYEVKATIVVDADGHAHALTLVNGVEVY